MTLRRLESFLALAREGTFTRAAHRLHLSQPTLSEHVLDLEHELGIPFHDDDRPLSGSAGAFGRLLEAEAKTKAKP